MERAYRAGAAVAATATLLAGAAYTVLRDPAEPAPAAAIPGASPAAGPDELAALRAETAALRAEIAARRRALATPAGESPATSPPGRAGDDDEEHGDDD